MAFGWERLRPHLRDHTPETLASLWGDLGMPLAAARRIVGRLVRDDRDDLDGIREVPRRLVEAVAARGRTTRLTIADRRRSAVDPFVKYLFRAEDGATFETVRIPLDRPRWSVCVSSQAGCAFACAFCETGRLGLVRNLEAWEIVEQVLTVRREGPERPVTSVVFQGQGEPFANYDAVMRAARILRSPDGGRIRGEAITISTVGVLPSIDRYTREGHVHKLVLSLHSAFDAKREALLPVAARWEVAALAEAMRRHALARREVVHVAWTLIAGWNTGEDEASELSRLFSGVPVRVSVIDVNDPSGRFRRADDAERGRFLEALRGRGLMFSRRYSGGPDIHAACGMLASAARGGETI